MKLLFEIWDNLQARWVVFFAVLTFWVVAFGMNNEWETGLIVLVLIIAWASAIMAVGLDRVE